MSLLLSPARKRKLVIVANCQGDEIAARLRREWRVTKVFDVEFVSVVQNIDNPSVLCTVDDADVVFCRNVKKVKEFTPAAIRARVKPGCEVYILEYIYFDGFDVAPHLGTPWFVCRDDHLKESSWASFCAREHDTAALRTTFEACCETLRALDGLSDVKFADFFMRNYRSTRLFRNHNHPTGHLYDHLVSEVLRLLHIEPLGPSTCGTSTDVALVLTEGSNMVYSLILPCVKRALGLTFDDSCVNVFGVGCTASEFFDFGLIMSAVSCDTASTETCREMLLAYLIGRRHVATGAWAQM